jgi:pullulanase/glycogen debranching enzyme
MPTATNTTTVSDDIETNTREASAMAADDLLWFKDAVVYQLLHIKAFFDSTNDGVGDFKGLTSKLDYIKDLGVNTIGLLPFYPSPTTTTCTRRTAQGTTPASSCARRTGGACA